MPSRTKRRKRLGRSMREDLARIELQRASAGLTIEATARAAGIAVRRVMEWRSGASVPRRSNLARYQQAIRRAGRTLSGQDRLLLNLWDAVLVLVAREHGVCPATVRGHEPALRATRSPVWVQQQRVRWEAIYLLNTVFGVQQADIAKALGVTRQAVQQAVRAIEASRDGDLDADFPLDAALDARLTGLSHDLTETV
jgi:transcriptional regulator with XRE-family HTH domain